MKLIKFLKLFVIAVGISLFSVLAIAKPLGNTFTPAQTEQIKQIIHQYLIQNPQVLIEASQVLQKREMKKAQAKAIKAAKANAAELFRAPNSAIAGNPNGKVTIIEFFDYQCLHCREMTPIIQKLIKNNKNLRVVFKNFPIFGNDSVMASHAALAANMQGKFYPFHEALMTSKTRLTQKFLLSTAKKLNLDINKFTADMKNKLINKKIADNYKLAQEMGLTGTPEFLIAETGFTAQSKSPIFSIPGTASQADLQKMIEKAAGS